MMTTASVSPAEPAVEESPLPGHIHSMWQLVKLCHALEPQLSFASLGLQLLAALPRPLIALWVALLTAGALHGDTTEVYAACAALACSVCLTWLLALVSERLGRRFRDRLAVGLEARIAWLQASVDTIEHHERPEYLNRLTTLRQQVFMLDHLYGSLVITLTWLFRMGIILALLAYVDRLLLLLPLFAVPLAIVATRRPSVQRRVEEQIAPARRLAEHEFRLATTASAGKDLRLAGAAQQLMTDHAASWARWYRPIGRYRSVTAARSSAAWAAYGAGYGLGVLYLVGVADASAEALVLVLAAGIQLSDYLSAAVGEIGFISGVFLQSARRLAWLEDYRARSDERGTLPAPNTLTSGITLEDVDFTYPGSEQPVLRGLNLHLPAGSVVAIVGENGAGKSTLVKLLAKLYSPTSGQIKVDGRPLGEISARAWRERLSGAFQDFATFEFTARTTVGLGSLHRAESEHDVARAVDHGGAADVVARLPQGLATQLGASWPGGVEPSQGQWQRLALARGFMRPDPLLLMLDEPTAALDAETEHALFESFASAAHGERAECRITLLVSHRFSTVRMADLIVVLEENEITEAGTHESLMQENGTYAALYRIQEKSYQK